MSDVRETTYAEPLYSVARRTILADPPRVAEWQRVVRERTESATEAVRRRIKRRLAAERGR